MKRNFAFLLIGFILLSCSARKERYRIAGSIDGYEGNNIILACSPDGVSLKEISRSPVSNGKFAFDGDIGNSGIAYICYNGNGHEACTMFFLEKGETDIRIDSMGCRVTGTPLNNLSNTIDDSIRSYIGRLENIEEQYYSDTLSDDELERLGTVGFNLQEGLVGYLRGVIKENIGNLLGLYMLVVYNDFYTPKELSELIAQIPPSSIDPGNNPLYDIIIGIAQERKE